MALSSPSGPHRPFEKTQIIAAEYGQVPVSGIGRTCRLRLIAQPVWTVDPAHGLMIDHSGSDHLRCSVRVASERIREELARNDNTLAGSPLPASRLSITMATPSFLLVSSSANISNTDIGFSFDANPAGGNARPVTGHST